MAVTYDQIGSESFIKLEGEISPATVGIVEITRPGVDGCAYRKIGTRGQEFELQGVVDVASAAAAHTKIFTTYPALVGTIVTVKKETQDRTNVLVVAYQPIDRRPVRTSVGGTMGTGATYLVYSRWVLRYVGTS